MSEDCFLPRQVAQWNPTRGAWETGQQDLLSMHSELYLETWPASGMTRDGLAYELPTPELPTVDTGSSSLPTPRASRGASGTETMYKLGASRTDDGRTQGEVLLPTPNTSSGTGPGEHGTGGPNLQTVLLPTPVASEGVKATALQGSAQKALTGQVWLTNVAHDLATLNGELTNPPSVAGNA